MKLTLRKFGRSASAFTLIELLVVIAILAILAGLLYPVLSAVLERGRKVRASSDEKQIVLGVTAYFNEYGKYPIDVAKYPGDVVYSTNNNELIDVLRNRTGTAIGNAMNPHGVIFLNPKAAPHQSQPTDGIELASGVWYDPWGSPYNIAVDGDFDTVLNGPANPLPHFTPMPVHRPPGCWRGRLGKRRTGRRACEPGRVLERERDGGQARWLGRRGFVVAARRRLRLRGASLEQRPGFSQGTVASLSHRADRHQREVRPFVR